MSNLSSPRLARRGLLQFGIGAMVAVTGCLAAFSALADDRESDYRRLNVALVAHHVIPRYERLADVTDQLAVTAGEVCAATDQPGIDALQAGYHESLDAWMGVQHIRFGPIELFLRSSRFAFWPDPRNTAGKQLGELIAARDRSAIIHQAFIRGSVAVQGFPALERLLFGDGAVDALLASGEEAVYRCDLIAAIAENLKTMAADIVRDWRGGDVAYAEIVGHPGEENPYYHNGKEATLDLFQSLHAGMEIVADRKLAPPLGESAEDARPRLAESWRSERSLRNIRLNLVAAQQLYLGEGGFGFSAFLREVAGDPELDDLLRRAFDQTLATARGIDVPLDVAITDPAQRPAVERLAIETKALKQLIGDRLAAAIDIPMGFNSLDGD
ncbi:imelysin family protein [Rhodospirillaceae bacterium SYSU D60014]|uniref:imelysin family protein n=1 Tax=Virgifigura deserti TaxID=2268457 RepID=UPI000E674633